HFVPPEQVDNTVFATQPPKARSAEYEPNAVQLQCGRKPLAPGRCYVRATSPTEVVQLMDVVVDATVDEAGCVPRGWEVGDIGNRGRGRRRAASGPREIGHSPSLGADRLQFMDVVVGTTVDEAGCGPLACEVGDIG